LDVRSWIWQRRCQSCRGADDPGISASELGSRGGCEPADSWARLRNCAGITIPSAPRLSGFCDLELIGSERDPRQPQSARRRRRPPGWQSPKWHVLFGFAVTRL